MPTHHTVKAYEQELDHLDRVIAQMGEAAAAQLERAFGVLARQETEAARAVPARDAQVNALERDVDALTVRLLALRQPMADDLRNVVCALRVSIDLERIADYAANIAKRVACLKDSAPSAPLAALRRMGDVLLEMTRDALTAYRTRDDGLAERVWCRDDEVDQAYLTVLQDLRDRMTADPNAVMACTDLLFIVKNMERVGDHLTNVCEHVRFLVRGEPWGRHTCNREEDSLGAPRGEG
jgi:phosphate transport system protein